MFSSLNLNSAMCCVHVRVRAATIVKLVLWSILSFTWKEVIVRLRLGAELLCLWLVNTALLDWVGRLVSDVVSQLSVWRSVSLVGISLVSSLTCGFSERWVAEPHSVSSTIDNIQFCISTQCNLIKLASFSICCRWAKWYKSEAHAIACCIQPQWEITSSQKKEVTTTKLRKSLTTRHVLVWRDIFLCRLWSFQTELENDGVQCNMRMSN